MELFVPIALVLVGLALIVVEVTVIPGFNVIGVGGVVGMAVGVVMSFVTFGPSVGFVVLVGTLAASAGLLYTLWESGAWDRFILTDSLRRDDAADLAADETRAQMVGQCGTAVTPLRPGGVAEIGGQRVEVTTEGAFVAAGSRLRVIAIDRRRTLVRVEDEGTRAGQPGPDAE